jgi:hydroxymethylpyrimidine/phosphomethylpyrimidine kinase
LAGHSLHAPFSPAARFVPVVRSTVLVIAGSDSSGGAGIQADLKALDHIGVHGATALTCVTAQHSTGVRSVYPLSPGAVLDQATQVLDDLDVRAIKCGMLYSVPTIKAVADLIEDRDLPAVVDPVLVATSGGRLAKEGVARAYLEHLVPLAWAFTPNAHEAEAILGRRVHDERGAAAAGRALVGAGAISAVIKGGHLSSRSTVTDTLAYGAGPAGAALSRISSPRLRGQYHGAGCHFASFMAGFAAQGLSPDRAFRLAHGMLQHTLAHAEKLGRGARFLETPAQRFVVDDGLKTADHAIAWELAEAVLGLTALLTPAAVPEVGINFAYGRLRPRTAQAICAVDGRIVVSGKRAVASGPVRFGGSRHIARILLACASVAPSVRAVCNLKHLEGLAKRARRAGLTLATFDRALEPKPQARRVSTMSWGTDAAIRAFGAVPDLIADDGSVGKEPMVRVLGRRPADVVDKVRRLLR